MENLTDNSSNLEEEERIRQKLESVANKLEQEGFFDNTTKTSDDEDGKDDTDR